MTQPPNNICWHQSFPRCNCPEPDVILRYGRVRSGKRWFWHVWGWERHSYDEKYDAYGWADERSGGDRGGQAIHRSRSCRPADGSGCHSLRRSGASQGTEPRQAGGTPSTDTTDARPTEYLFGERSGIHDDGWNTPYYHIYAFPIVKKTAKRIYYKRKSLEWLPEIDAPDISKAPSRTSPTGITTSGLLIVRNSKLRARSTTTDVIGRKLTFICWQSHQRHVKPNQTLPILLN